MIIIHFNFKSTTIATALLLLSAATLTPAFATASAQNPYLIKKHNTKAEDKVNKLYKNIAQLNSQQFNSLFAKLSNYIAQKVISCENLENKNHQLKLEQQKNEAHQQQLVQTLDNQHQQQEGLITKLSAVWLVVFSLLCGFILGNKCKA